MICKNVKFVTLIIHYMKNKNVFNVNIHVKNAKITIQIFVQNVTIKV